VSTATVAVTVNMVKQIRQSLKNTNEIKLFLGHFFNFVRGSFFTLLGGLNVAKNVQLIFGNFNCK